MKFNILKDFIKNPQMYRFLAVGMMSSISVLLLTGVLTSVFGIFYVYSVIVSLEILTCIAFFIHDRWTFSNVSKSTKTITRFLKYNFFSLTGFGINESILIFLTTQIKIHYLISEGIAIVITFFLNFIISKKITWKK